MPRCRLLRKFLVAGICLAAPAVWGDTLTYSDNFERSPINSFWTINQQPGTVELSTSQNHTPSGSQSREFASSNSSGQLDMPLTHTFSTETQGEFTVWFYDNDESFSDQIYDNMLALGNGGEFPLVFVGTQYFDPTSCGAVLDTISGRTGPDANCGPFSGTAATDVTQTVAFGPENSAPLGDLEDFNAAMTSGAPEPSTLGALAVLLGSLATRRKGWSSKPR